MWTKTEGNQIINSDKLDEIRIENYPSGWYVVGYGEFNPSKKDYERYVFATFQDEKIAKNYLGNLLIQLNKERKK